MRSNTAKIFLAAFFILVSSIGCLETASDTVTDVTGGTPASSASSGEDATVPQNETDVGTYVGNGAGIPDDTNVGTYVGNGTDLPSGTNVGTYNGSTKNLISFVTVSDSSSVTVSSETDGDNTTTESTAPIESAEESTETIAQEQNSEMKIPTENTETTVETVPADNNVSLATEQSSFGMLPPKTGSKPTLAPKYLIAPTSKEPWPYDYCFPVDTNFHAGTETQTCFVTPNNYNLGILKISLAKCLDHGDEVPCDSGAYDASETFTLYDGDQIDTTIGDAATLFSEALADIDTDFTAGGLHIESAYFEQKFPETGEEAEKIVEHLRGKTYRICTIEAPDAETRLKRCGNAEAGPGDLLIDMDGDGDFGFMDMDGATETDLNELTTRPEGYRDLAATKYYQDAINRLSEMTLSLGGTYGFGASKHYQIAVSFNISDTMLFTDGSIAGSGGIMGLVCVSAIASHDCAIGDADPFSVGMYNPYYDSGLIPTTPIPSVTVQELVEE